MKRREQQQQQQLGVGDGQKSHIHTDQMRFSRPPSHGARELRCARKRDFLLLLHAILEAIGRLKRFHVIREGEKTKTRVRFALANLAALQVLLTASVARLGVETLLLDCFGVKGGGGGGR